MSVGRDCADILYSFFRSHALVDHGAGYFQKKICEGVSLVVVDSLSVEIK